jgi:glycosyltransferase involved in cell wall biosynthesis
VVRLAFAVPGSLMTPTGGYAYARRIIPELRTHGFDVEVVDLGDGFPRPDEAVRRAAIARIETANGPIVVDGLALGVLPELARLPPERGMIGLVHHPLALESGLSLQAADALQASERAALAGACHVIATSATTARLLESGYGLPAANVTVVEPGTDRVPLARGSGGDTPALLAVGTLVPRKGFDILVAALARIAELPWRLTIVGDPSRDAATAAAIAADIARHGLAPHVTLAGVVSDARLSELYAGSDLFVLASRFEGYGMAYAEAIAHGLPVVGCKGGAIADTVGSAGVLVDADDVEALADALRALLGDRARRERLAAAARAAARLLPSWQDSGRRFADAIEQAVRAHPRMVTS